MGCCQPYEIPFGNASSIEVAYTDDMKRNLGPFPKVEVFLWNEEAGQYYSTNGIPGMEIKFNGNTVHVDFGGTADGYVKIS